MKIKEQNVEIGNSFTVKAFSLKHQGRKQGFLPGDTIKKKKEFDSLGIGIGIGIGIQADKQRLKPSKQKHAYASAYASAYAYDKAYVEENLIAYIGNKRRLLPLISRALERIERDQFKAIQDKAIQEGGKEAGGSTLKERRAKSYFIDFFAGTGIVSRFALSLGFKVIANDWEPYAYTLNKAFLEHGREETLSLFRKEGGIDKLLSRYNKLHHVDSKDAYISKYYSPKSTKHADPEKERLFYTAENGQRIDAIRAQIDKDYPIDSKIEAVLTKRSILLGLLLVEASKRSNTSGVFKAFHHGFGGRKKDALGRILKPLWLPRPHFLAQAQQAKVFQTNALSLATKLSKSMLNPLKGHSSIAYLDPPYNQHQYGSNYHLLNSVALNDKLAQSKSFVVDGKKIAKGGIRKDWIKTRSGFCYKKTAKQEFKSLVEHIQADFIMVSYSSEGLISFDDMLGIVAKKGKPSIVATDYTRFRGARQSNITRTRNLEFVLICNCWKTASLKDIQEVRANLLLNRLKSAFQPGCFYPKFSAKLGYTVAAPESKCSKNNAALGLHIVFKSKSADLAEAKQETLFQKRGLYRNVCLSLDSQLGLDTAALEELKQLSFSKQQKIFEALMLEQPASNEERITAIMDVVQRFPENVDIRFFLSEILRLFNKLAAKKDAKVRSRCQEKLRLFLPKINAEKMKAFNKALYEKFEIEAAQKSPKQRKQFQDSFSRHVKALMKAVA